LPSFTSRSSAYDFAFARAFATAAARADAVALAESRTNGVAPWIWMLSPAAATTSSTTAPALVALRIITSKLWDARYPI
jgi:hypothetical protein